MTMAGILGPGMGQPGILGGMQQPQMPRVPFAQNPVITTLAASLMAGRTPQKGLENFGQALPYAMNAKMGMQDRMVAQQEKTAADAESKAKQEQWNQILANYPDIPAEMRPILMSNPALATEFFKQKMAPPPAGTDDMREYDKALSQGYDGSFTDYMMEMRKAGASNVTVGGGKYGTIPPGYMLDETPDGAVMKPIPGGPADTTKTDAARQEQKGRYGDVVLEDIRRAKEKVKDQTWYAPVTGVGGQVLSGVGGSASADTAGLISTIESSISFDRLQAMRESSPTGGALGAVSERELQLLSSTLGSIKQSQSQEQLLQNLDRLEKIYEGVMKKASAYPNAAEFGFAGSTPSAPNAGVFEWSPDAGLRPAQ